MRGSTKADVKRVKEFLCDTDFLSITKTYITSVKTSAQKKENSQQLNFNISRILNWQLAPQEVHLTLVSLIFRVGGKKQTRTKNIFVACVTVK